jgi:putative ABC transport system ATP-binding protein
MPDLLEVERLRFSRNDAGAPFTLLVDALRLAPGERFAVTGPSGCGKSTLLGLLALALPPASARRLALAGSDAMALWRAGKRDRLTALRGALIGFVPQTATLLPFLTLAGNIALPLRLAGSGDRKTVRDLADVLGIAGVLHRRPAEVSVGQRQRAAVARALVRRPRLLLADEPTAAVHPTQAAGIMALLAALAQADGTAVLIATHDQDGAAAAGFSLLPCNTERDGITTRLDRA